jgi:N-acetylneuraminate synthase
MTFDSIFIIAEVGVNHNGSFETALQLIDVAKEVGADAVKFQSFKADHLVTKKAPLADYQKRNVASLDNQYNMLKKLELSFTDQKKLKEYCDQINIQFLSSPFDETDALFLIEELGLKTVKIGSGEITNLKMLYYIGQKKVSIILSTGMSCTTEIQEAVGAIGLGFTESDYPTKKNCRTWYLKNKDNPILYEKVSLLHCTSNYPAPVGELNLKAIQTMSVDFKLRVGFSDHSDNLWAACNAYGLGARIFEKHFTLSKSQEGPDHKASLEPSRLKKYIYQLRQCVLSFGDGIKKAQKSELNTIKAARKYIVALTEIKSGNKFDTTNLGLKRTGGGLCASKYYELMTKSSKSDYIKDEIIKNDELPS